MTQQHTLSDRQKMAVKLWQKHFVESVKTVVLPVFKSDADKYPVQFKMDGVVVSKCWIQMWRKNALEELVCFDARGLQNLDMDLYLDVVVASWGEMHELTKKSLETLTHDGGPIGNEIKAFYGYRRTVVDGERRAMECSDACLELAAKAIDAKRSHIVLKAVFFKYMASNEFAAKCKVWAERVAALRAPDITGRKRKAT